MASAATTYGNNYYWPDKTKASVEPEDPKAAVPLLSERVQNDLNATQSSPEKHCWIRYGNSTFSCSKSMGIFIISVAGLILLAGIISICALFVMVGTLSVQQIHMRSLQSENTALKEQVESLSTNARLHENRTNVCEKDLLAARHSLEISERDCTWQKANITKQFEQQLREVTREKENLETRLGECEREKTNAANEKQAVAGRLDECEREKNEMAQRHAKQVQDTAEAMNNIRCPPCNTGASSYYYPRNGAIQAQTTSHSVAILGVFSLLSCCSSDGETCRRYMSVTNLQ